MSIKQNLYNKYMKTLKKKRKSNLTSNNCDRKKKKGINTF